MGIWARLLNRQQPEQRLSPGVWSIGSGLYTGDAGAAVPVHLAESLSTVLGCVELISAAVASLPASLTIDGAPAPSTAPAWRLLDRPNTWQSWPAFMSWMTASILLHGNGLAWVSTDGRGSVNGLVPAPWPWLLPQVITGAGGARLAFDVVNLSAEQALLGLPRRLLGDRDCLHIKARSDTGVLGRSVLGRAAGVVREGLSIATLARSNWDHGMRPSSILSMPAFLDDIRRKRFREETLPELSGENGQTI